MSTDLTINKRVAIWRSHWLPYSESFIVSQATALPTWQPLYFSANRLATADVFPPPVNKPLSTLEYRKLQAVGRCAKLETAIRRHRPAVIHSHFGLDGTLMAGIAKSLAIPHIVTFHGYDATSLPGRSGPEGVIYRRRLRNLFSTSAQILTVSHFLKARLIDLGADADRVTTVYLGTPIDYKVAGLSDDGKREGILFVGRLVEKKGTMDLLKAVASLGGELARTPIRIIGDGPELANLRIGAARMRLNVIFMGRQTSSVIDAHMRSARIFCGPSKTAASGDAEGLGLVFLEAAKNSCPVVAYRHGGVPEAVRHEETGLLAPEGDVPALSSALKCLLIDARMARTLGRQGRDFVIKSHDSRKCAERLEEVMASVATARQDVAKPSF